MTPQHTSHCDTEFGAINGWRVSITRLHQRLVRYFSDLEYGGSTQSRQEAEHFRKQVYERLRSQPGQEAQALLELAAAYSPEQHPLGLLLALPHSRKNNLRKVITLRMSPQMEAGVADLCEHLGIDACSIMRLALYHYIALVKTSIPRHPERDHLQQHLNTLEQQAAAAGLPSFAAFVATQKTPRQTPPPTL